MPQNYWGHVLGLPDSSITDTTATTAGADVEIRYDLDASMTRPQVLESIERLKGYILTKDTWPPI
jgi:hypothetical protein